VELRHRPLALYFPKSFWILKTRVALILYLALRFAPGPRLPYCSIGAITEASATAVGEVTSKASPSARRIRAEYAPYT
jgi:hypothetical protein